ncbi:MAG: DUF4837 family protein, partial [Tidjanibacter sp.]|nr:DUF4837 family protein [Tidjanibacter sp.]
MKRFFHTLTTLCFVAAATIATTHAQGKFTYDDIARGKFSARSVSSLRSMNDGEHYTVYRSGAIIRYDYATGNPVDTLLDTRTLGLPTTPRSYQFSGDESQIMFTYNSRALYRRSAFSSYAVYSRATGKVDIIGDELRMAVLAPSGDKVAYVKDNNVYIYSLVDGSRTAVTTDGKWNHIINGVPDWVYEEEWAIDRTLCWSPDGERLAWLRTDESHVKEFPFTQFNTADPNSNYTSIYSYKYPKAGEQNSFVTLWVYDTKSGSRKQVDVGPELDQYVPFFDWTPDGKLYFFRINRLQNHLEIVLNEADGSQRTIYEEQSPKYIDAISASTITFLDDKRFIVRNETATGWMHLYLYHTEKGLLNPITSGEWEVTSVVAMDNKNIWYISTERSPLERDFYRIGINGKNKKRLSTDEGTWRVSASVDWRNPDNATAVDLKYGNILKLSVEPTIVEPIFSVAQNVYARPQTIVTAKASSAEALTTFIKDNAATLREIFEQAERTRSNAYYRAGAAELLIEDFKNHTGYEMLIPANFYKANTRDKSLLWYIRDYKNKAQYIFAFKYPYTDVSDFTPEWLMRTLDNKLSTISSKGAVGSYMGVNESGPAIVTEQSIAGKKWYELR